MKKTILVICNNSSGFYILRKELIVEALKMYNMIILAPSTGFERELEELGCKYHEIEYDGHGTNPFEEIGLIRKYRTWIVKLKPDIVLTYAIKPNVYGGIICKWRRIPYIVNITGLGNAFMEKGILQTVSLLLYRMSLKKASMVFFQNKDNLEFMLRKKVLGRNNYALIPGSGVNLTQYKALDYPDDSIIRFYFIARIMKEKGIEQIIDAAEYFHSTPNVEFHICGGCGDDYSDRIRKLNEKGIITYHGVVNSRDDMIKVYQTASCVVHPTYYAEGISNVLLEASASARPIIATDRTGCREIIDDGENGLLIREKDSDDLIEKLKYFISLPWDERKKMGMRGREKVEREFSREIVVNAYIQAIDSLINPESATEN